MEITPPPTTTVKNPDPKPTTLRKHLPPPLTNGVLKRHKPLHYHQPSPVVLVGFKDQQPPPPGIVVYKEQQQTSPEMVAYKEQPPPGMVAYKEQQPPPSGMVAYKEQQPPPVVVAYKECMKNHAATMGGHAVDGCGEFMPSPSCSPSYPASLKCAACGCHRNFHRREPEETLFTSPNTHIIEYQPHHRHHPPPPPTTVSPGNSPSPPPISSSYYPSAPHMLLALSSGVSAPTPDNNYNNHIPAGDGSAGANSSGKKRFRTKFTHDQKEKMHELAERVGWKMQKQDEEMINRFCHQIGVDRNVFKVWMHNNKTTFGKKDLTNINGNNSSGDCIDFMTSRNNNNHHVEDTGNNHLNLQYNNGGNGNVICTKGSSSSS